MYCYFSDISMYLVTTPLNTLHFRWPFSSVQTRGSLSSDSCWWVFFSLSLFYAKFYSFRLCRENTAMEQTNVLFCCIVHFICAESLTQWIWKYKAILCVMSTFYLFMLCDFSFFFMKVPFSPSCSTLGTYSIPHSLLLYSVHVKWILICVQNVIKMKIHLIIYFVHPCRVWWFISIYGDFDIWKQAWKLDSLHTLQDNLLQFKASIRMGRKGDSSGFECCMVFLGARHAALNISETADLRGFSGTAVYHLHRVVWKLEDT